MSWNVCVAADFQLMRCIAKIAEVVYPKLESRPLVPLTPRRRTHSLSVPYDFPSPVPSDDDTENESDGETVEHRSSQKKIYDDDSREENVAKLTDQLQHQSDDSSSQCDSTQTTTPEPCSKLTESTRSEGEKYSSVVTKMLFEILQNLLADILAILEKVARTISNISINLLVTYFYNPSCQENVREVGKSRGKNLVREKVS